MMMSRSSLQPSPPKCQQKFGRPTHPTHGKSKDQESGLHSFRGLTTEILTTKQPQRRSMPRRNSKLRSKSDLMPIAASRGPRTTKLAHIRALPGPRTSMEKSSPTTTSKMAAIVPQSSGWDVQPQQSQASAAGSHQRKLIKRDLLNKECTVDDEKSQIMHTPVTETRSGSPATRHGKAVNLSLESYTVRPWDDMSVEWRRSEESDGQYDLRNWDFIAVYKEGETCDMYIASRYMHNPQEGQMNLVAPLEPGRYHISVVRDVRYILKAPIAPSLHTSPEPSGILTLIFSLSLSLNLFRNEGDDDTISRSYKNPELQQRAQHF